MAPQARPVARRTTDGRFHNPWPDSEPRELSDVLRWNFQRWRQTLAKTPPRGSFPIATPEISRPRSSARDIRATWIGHATVLLQFGGLNVITDPMFSARASPVQWAGPRRVMDPAMSIDALPPIDVVLLSHNHYDHLDKVSVKRIAAAHPHAVWMVPLELSAVIRGWGPREIIELDWWQHTVVQGMRVTATPARHFSARAIRDRNKTLWCGFALELHGRRVLYAGDTAYYREFGEVAAAAGPFDLTIIPIGAYDPRWFMNVVHVNPEEAVQIYQDLTAAHRDAPLPLMLAVHWGTFRLTDEAMDEPPRRARARWREVGLPDERLWIARFGETRSVPG